MWATVYHLYHYKDCSTYFIGMGLVPSFIDVWGYDREFSVLDPAS